MHIDSYLTPEQHPLNSGTVLQTRLYTLRHDDTKFVTWSYDIPYLRVLGNTWVKAWKSHFLRYWTGGFSMISGLFSFRPTVKFLICHFKISILVPGPNRKFPGIFQNFPGIFPKIPKKIPQPPPHPTLPPPLELQSRFSTKFVSHPFSPRSIT